MEEKKELKNITIKLAIGLIIINIISHILKVLILGIEMNRITYYISRGIKYNEKLITSISSLSFFIILIFLYYFMNKIVFKGIEIKKDNIIKIIRNTSIINFFIILINILILFENEQLLVIKYSIIYSMSTIIMILKQKKILYNKYEKNEIPNRKIIFYIGIFVLVIIISLFVLIGKENFLNKQLKQVNIFLEIDINEKQKEKIVQSLKELKDVKILNYISKEKMIEEIRKKYGNKFNGYENALGVEKIEIKIENKNIDKIKNIYQDMEGINYISVEGN